MKRRILPLILAALLLSGCCYAPGHDGDSLWEGRYQLPEWLEADYTVATEPKPTEPVDASPMANVPIPTPEVDLEALPERSDNDIVNALDYIPDLVVDLRYAGSNNFTGQPIYDFEGVYLRYGTVQKLMQVQQALRDQGYLLKIWDAYRPVTAQQTLWSAKPDSAYMDNPQTGYSPYSCANTVAVTIVDAEGNELVMPSGFDEFSALADRNYDDCSAEAAENAKLLESVMEANGFESHSKQWWCYSDSKDYAVETVFDPGVISVWYAVCNEYINLRKEPNVSASVVTTIAKDQQFTLLGWSGGFAYVEYRGQRGYVNADYIKKVGT